MRRPATLAACFAALLLAPSPSLADEPRLLGRPREDYRARRLELMKRVREAESRRLFGGSGRKGPVVVLKGAEAHDGEDYEEGRFRQSNAFAYLTGVEIPGAALILLPAEARATLYLPPRRDRRLGGPDRSPAPGPEAARDLGFDRVESTQAFLGDLFTAIGDAGRPGRSEARSASVYTLGADAPPGSLRPDARFARFLREAAPGAPVRDLAPTLAELRKAKAPSEIALLRRAIAITGDAQDAVMAAIRPGLYEYQLEGKILGAFLDGGALRPGFASIVGSGPNATIPHYFENGRRIEDGDLVVVDIGAEYRLYTADITRTYPASGRFSDRQRAIYQLVLDAQADAAAHVEPGETRLMELTGHARAFLAKSPLRAKDESGRERTMDHFFIHGLSHYLGMDVHDVGDTSRPMRPGEVFTIEPGIYIPGEALGVRIEDDYLVTESGVEKLSKAIPSDPDEVERRIASARSRREAAADRP